MKVCVVGGGGSVAVATRIITDKMPEASINVFTKRDVAGYRPCELTYVLGGRIPEFETIVAFDAEALEAKKVKYHFKTSVTEINRAEKYIVTTEGRYDYDKLILATGAAPVLPDIPGADGENVFTLGTDMQYARNLVPVISTSGSALIIGAGAIGLEVAELLARRGYEKVTVCDVADRPLARSLDKKTGEMVREKLTSMGVEFLLGCQVAKILGSGSRKKVVVNDREIEADFVLVSAGFRPNSELARACGLDIGTTGAIKVNRYMVTSDPDIYAIGDVAESWDLIAEKPCLNMKADNAVRSGKVAARHLAGETLLEHPGTVGAFIIYLDDIFVGSVGYTEEMAATLPGREITAVWHEGMSLPKYLGGCPVKIKLVVDSTTGQLLGAQMLSKANIAADLDRLALAIMEKIPVPKLAVSEMIYTPASGWPYGPVAQALDKVKLA